MNQDIPHQLASFLFALTLCAFCSSGVVGQTSGGGVGGQNPRGGMSGQKQNPRGGLSTPGPRKRQTREGKSKITINRNPRLINLLIISDPPNASIFIEDKEDRDGDKYQGVTNNNGEYEVELPPKTYLISVNLTGHTPLIKEEMKILPTPFKQQVTAELVPVLNLITLNVTTDPPEVELTFDGSYVGTSGPDGLYSIKQVNPTLPHTLRGRKQPGFITNEVPVPPGLTEVPIKLLRDSITLKVTTIPPEVEVYLDDVYKGISNKDGLLLIEQVNPAQTHTLRGRKVPEYTTDDKVSVLPNSAEATIKLSLDPVVVRARGIKQLLTSGKLLEAVNTYNNLSQERPDHESLPRLLDSIMQSLQTRSSNLIMQMGPYGLALGVEEAREMSQLYEQARKLRQGDSAIAGFSEYWKMKYLVARAQQTSVPAERESIGRNALAVASLVDVLNSQNPYVVFDSAWVHKKLGNSSTAKKDYELAQRLNPNWAFPYFALGLMDMSAAEQEKAKAPKLAGYQAAIDKFTKAISVKPDFFQAYALRCLSYAVLNMHQEAIANGQQAVAMKPQSAYSHFALGFAYYQKGKPEYRNALNEFERALSLKEDELDEATKISIQEKLARVKKSLGIKAR